MVLLFSSACITSAILFLLISPSSSVTSFLPPFENKLRTSSHVSSSGERVVSSINWNRLKKEREETEENSNSLDLQETQEGEAFDKRSPLYLHLPDCRQGDFQRIQKKTNKKGLICPMFRDEEGFLAEFLVCSMLILDLLPFPVYSRTLALIMVLIVLHFVVRLITRCTVLTTCFSLITVPLTRVSKKCSLGLMRALLLS